MAAARATTQQYEFTFPEAITAYDTVLISFGQDGDRILDKDKSDLTLVSGTTYSLVLEQEDTRRFDPGIIEIQVRGLKDGVAWASQKYRDRIVDVINDTIIEEED